ncbi:hypothetical protein PVAP13_7NG446101 [Panicum virgatum]|uniref:CCHC-type domain-containing protein n=1 Tax=Panicum virgatum TaxID=38727 RepID=A0A8T0Q7D2_PANVG|nr:hypothetical protein PVAP13_7NG446101 [Panicum virgatum]
MADARRSYPRRAPSPPPRSRTAPLVDADGFQRVVSKRQLRAESRRARRPPPRRPVPADLVGRCFNCLSHEHIAARCTFPSRCLRCEREGHSARYCKRGRSGAPSRNLGRPFRRIGACRDAAAAALLGRHGRSAASASTVPSGSASTGRQYSGPPSICGPSAAPSPVFAWSPCPPPLLPRGHPSRRPSSATVTIPRSDALQAEEDVLSSMALTAIVVGTRPSFSPSAVHRFIVENYHVPADGFTIHRFHPEDFLLVFKEVVVLERVLHAPPLPVADMVLRFRRWRRLASADAESMKFRVLLEMRGIPSHVWSVDTAQRILGDACADPVPTPATIARRDLRRFQAAAWCVDPDLIPNEVVIRIPEPVDTNVGAELFLRSAEIIFHSQPLLRHRVEIEILEIQDWNDDSDSSVSPYDIPDRLNSDSNEEDVHPGVRRSSRSCSCPRRTVFRKLDDPGSLPVGAGGGGSDAPADSIIADEVRSEGGPTSPSVELVAQSPAMLRATVVGPRLEACPVPQSP